MTFQEIKYRAIVIGTSAGGLDALSVLLHSLKKDIPVPIIIVLHISPNSDSYLLEYLNNSSALHIKEAEEKETLKAGTVYFAPPDYHLLIEEDNTVSLSNSEKVNYSRPSIDVLFETATWAFGKNLIGIVLTGANLDGADGLKKIKEKGGLTICENPETAATPRMPKSAIELANPDQILDLDKIAPFLNSILS